MLAKPGIYPIKITLKDQYGASSVTELTLMLKPELLTPDSNLDIPTTDVLREDE